MSSDRARRPFCSVSATSIVDQLEAAHLLGLKRLRGAACACTPSLEPLLARG